MISCRECGSEASADALTCPSCGAPRPARTEWNGEGFEWKSTRCWHGWPLLHVAFGIDRSGRLRAARGIIAIGQRAKGAIAIGIIAEGVIAIGLVAIGIAAFGVVAIAAALACGFNAIAPCAIGIVAVGYAAGGLHTISWTPLFHAKG